MVAAGDIDANMMTLQSIPVSRNESSVEFLICPERLVDELSDVKHNVSNLEKCRTLLCSALQSSVALDKVIWMSKKTSADSVSQFIVGKSSN